MTVALGELAARFERTYGVPPAAIARAPGRVNLIGEHIDYCGLPVLPMALERSAYVAFRRTERGEVRIASTTRGLEPARFPAMPPIPPGPAGDWANYARAAVEALRALRPGSPWSGLEIPAGEADAPIGFDALVDTDLPVAAGLSSSSALVVGVAIAALAARGKAPLLGRPGASVDGGDPKALAARTALAEVLAAGERYVGTAGGGMDQAASLLGRAGHALRIDFDPLRATPIPIPEGWRVLVAHSGERAEKSGRAQALYNERTEHARRALDAVRAAAGVEPDDGIGKPVGYPGLIRALGHDALLAVADDVLENPLGARFRHIVEEARRVVRFEVALRGGDLEAAGRTLLASHASLRDGYEVSTARLDALVAAAMSAGAAGARLTGAGLGGCIVALCAEAEAPRILVDLRRASPDAPVFVARAGDGAEFLEIEA